MYNADKRPKNHIDFRTLDKSQLRELANTWEEEAVKFEQKLDSYTQRAGNNPSPMAIEKINRLHEIGNALWKRVRILERWQINNKPKIKALAKS